MNYCSGTIDFILNENYVSILSFFAVFNLLGVQGSTGMNRSFTWALSGWSGAHPGWLVWNYRNAVGVSVTATIISSRIVLDNPGNLPGWSWALPGVSETIASN
jgi:hypothetical protein